MILWAEHRALPGVSLALHAHSNATYIAGYGDIDRISRPLPPSACAALPQPLAVCALASIHPVVYATHLRRPRAAASHRCIPPSAGPRYRPRRCPPAPSTWLTSYTFVLVNTISPLARPHPVVRPHPAVPALIPPFPFPFPPPLAPPLPPFPQRVVASILPLLP
ncbi:hypothetical protein C8R47DRAFT_1225557 [Mycena vitilis]|nr:hypothetical protein C8R47DRAFT_1225557 [Mycena vitilis]